MKNLTSQSGQGILVFSFLFYLSFVALQTLSSQSFTNINGQFPRFYFSANTAWGDYDNDGDLDVIMCGDTTRWSPNVYITRLYQNDGNNQFSLVNSSININSVGDYEWGDYDNDGDLDLLYSVVAGSDLVNSLVVFQNEGAGDFTPLTVASFENSYELGAISWMDWDNDGDKDIINFPRGYVPLKNEEPGTFPDKGKIEPSDAASAVTDPPMFYRNTGNNTFELAEISLPHVLFGMIEAGDLNNDGCTDIIATGVDTAFVFLNQMNDNFAIVPLASDLEYYGGNIDLADYDCDGDLDVAIIGLLFDPWLPYYINVLKNDGTGNFTKIPFTDFDLFSADIDFGDYNNDGDPDLIFSGHTGWWFGNPSEPYDKTEFYRNDGNDTFTFEDFGITAYGFGNQEWGDYNNDGRLDLAINGYEPAAIYQSAGFEANTPPEPPENLQVTYNQPNNCFELSWDSALDAQTPSSGLSYNVRIGTYPGGDDVLSPMADLATGWRLIPETGNAGQNTFFNFCNPPFGQYYWSVQAIDAGFAGSEFSAEGSFRVEIIPLVTTLPVANVGATTATLMGMIQTGQMQVETGFVLGRENDWNAFPATPSTIPWTTLDTISLSLNSLDTSTTYHYAAFARINDHVKEPVYVYGDTLTFTTGQNPGTISGDTVTDITFYSARLHGVINPEGLTMQVGFEIGSDTTFGIFIPATPGVIEGNEPVEFEAVASGVAPGKAGFFRLKALYENGVLYGETRTFQTLARPDKNFTFQARKTENLIGTYTDISLSGNPIAVENTDDCFSSPVDFGFTFKFAEADFDQFILNTNGFIKLGSVPASDSTQFFATPDAATGGNFASELFNDVYIISPFNHDFESGSNQAEFNVLTEGDSGQRVCTIQFKNLHEKLESPARQFDNIEFQIKLHETTGMIEFVYGNWQNSSELSATRVASVGLKIAGAANGQVLTVWKWFENPWSQPEFWDGNYYEDEGWNAFDYSNDPALMPEPGRTFRFYPKQAHDATVAEIFTMGKLPIPIGLPHTISTYIKNTGYDTLYNIPVQLNVTGNNLFSEFVEIPVLKPDSGILISFPGFNPDVLGFNNVNVSLPFTDDFIPDNTKDFIQEITTNHYSYSDTNGIQSALGMVWVPGPGSPNAQWLARYPVAGTRSIIAARIGVGYGTDHQVYAIVLNAEGDLLAQSANYHLTEETSWQYVDFEFPEPPVISNDDFYIGLFQTESPVTYFPIGFQREDPIRPGAFYHGGLSGLPIENSGSARLCIEAITGDVDYCRPTFADPCGVYHYITGFQTFGAVSDIENINSGCAAYTLFTGQTLTVEPGAFFDFEVDGSFYHSQVEIWADWNCDGDFDDDADIAYFTNNLNEDDFEDRIYIPADATAGQSRLRIVAHYLSDPASSNPCGNYETGECEDYLLTINPPSPMVFQSGTTIQCDTARPLGRNETNREIIKIRMDVTGSLNPLTVTSINISPQGCTDFENDVDHVNIYFTGNYDTFSTNQLFGTADDLNNPITGNISLIYGPNYFWVTFTTSNTATLGNFVDAACEGITLNGTETVTPEVTSPDGRIKIDYCLPLFSSPGGCEAGIGCQSFITEGGIENINNPDNGCPGNDLSYSDFTDQKLTATKGSIVDFFYATWNWWQEVELYILIDWNHDIDFDDPGESYGYLVTDFIEGQITVPGDALPGTTRMRLLTWQFWQPKLGENSNKESWFCGFWSDQGEIEDYSFEVVEAPVMTQTIEIPAGWSGFSTYVEPEINAMSEMLEPIENVLIIISDFNQVYWPGENLNTFNDGWQSTFGAQIKLSSEASLPVEGRFITRQAMLYQGWNFFPVLSECAANVEEVFSLHLPYLKIVKEIAGTGVYWPEYNINSLGNLIPGKAYLLYWDFYMALPVVYPQCNNTLKSIMNNELQIENLPWNLPVMTKNSHIVAIPEKIASTFTTGDFIGAFTQEGFCAGLSVFDNKTITVTLFEDDPFTAQKEGFVENEPVNLRLFRKSSNSEVLCQVLYSDREETSGLWKANGLSVISQIITDYDLPQNESVIVYPNPTKNDLIISGITGKGLVELFNTDGKLVLSQVTSAGNRMLKTDYISKGLYFLKLTTSDKVYTFKVVFE